MNLIALDLPDELSDWPSWLEQQLVGVRLRELIRQLEIVQGADAGSATSLDVVLSDRRQAVLGQGLSALNETQLKLLVKHPRLLLKLQEVVLIEGGEYWHTVPRATQEQAAVAEHWPAISKAISRATVGERLETVAEPSPSVERERPARYSDRRWIVAFVALAAGALLALLPWREVPSEGKFFTRRGVIDSSLKDRKFLDHVARSVVQDWQPELKDPREFLDQLKVFHQSCESFLSADLNQLPAGTAVELKELCKKWRDKIQKNIADLERGAALTEVRSEANATILKIQPALSALVIRA